MNIREQYLSLGENTLKPVWFLFTRRKSEYKDFTFLPRLFNQQEVPNSW
jgi:hypothetical protein